MPFQDLQKKMQWNFWIHFSISQDGQAIEYWKSNKNSQTQSKSQEWYELSRAGRIRESVMETGIQNKFSQIYHLSSRVATDCGNEHEKASTECYFSIFSSSLENLTIRDSSLIINPNYPCIGASPDASIVECKCCRIRCLEIKWLYSHRDSIPQMLGKKLYLHKNAEGKEQLSQTIPNSNNSDKSQEVHNEWGRGQPCCVNICVNI